ncbi:MAG: hypothetical protein JNM78_13125 [Cyclobacteriaceae bacterium]|nr:hypothetical protein [Cyclobacteriaceae bacterium]
MKRIVWVIFAILLVGNFSVCAQDEGAITKKARVVSKANTVYISAGPSLRFAGNSSDYSGGLQVTAGYLKRMNRIVSMGSFLSFTKFDYDSALSNKFFIEENGYEIKKVQMQGGDLKLSSIGLDIRFDLIPSERVKKVAVFGIVKPFILLAKRTDVNIHSISGQNNIAPGEPGHNDNPPKNWYKTGDEEDLNSSTPGYSRLGAKTEFSGGIQAGIGGAFVLPSGLAFSLQSTVGATLPITHIDTRSFSSTLETYNNNPNFPFVKKSFASLNISLGVSYTF